MRKLFSTTVSDNAFAFAMLVFRLGIGGLMLVNHGWDKLSHFSQKSGSFSNPFGVGPTASFSLVVFAEFFCAAFIILGLFTRLATIPLIIGMSVAFVTAHKMNYAPPYVKGGGEEPLVFLICFIVLLFTGPGKISLDRLIGK
jgi:putative oxidoreductase